MLRDHSISSDRQVFSPPIVASLLASLLAVSTAAAGESAPTEEEGFFDLSIEQLMQEEITSTASLTQTSVRMTPAAMTTITHEQIQASGARSLFELLDIYVPNLQWARNSWEADNLGLRGIMTDRDDKYLLLVNGRVMNERTHYGVVSERDLVMLRDIHHIDVVRGPGSALYGPGAVSMVINIVTYNAATFEGTELTGRAGAVEEFYSAEFKHGRKFEDEDGGVFLYAGAGHYLGADKHDAPYIMTRTLTDTSIPSGGTQEGEPLLNPSIPNDGEDYRGLPPVKLYGQFTRGGWDIWARFTRGGKQLIWEAQVLTSDPYGWAGSWILPYVDGGYGYKQGTLFIGKTVELGSRTTLDASFSYDVFDFEVQAHSWLNHAAREDKYVGKAVLRHDVSERIKVAAGTEVLHGEYGYDSLGWPDLPAVIGRVGTPVPRWSTNLYSAFGEVQGNINEQWTVFLGGRVDDHTYTKPMYSPRAAVIFTPTAKDTYKLMWARSVRSNYEEELKAAGGSNNQPEKLSSLELRYERQQNEHLDFAASAFVHYDLKLIGFDGATNQTVPVATQRDWGIEVEAAYHTEKTRVAISHGFTKLYAFNLEPGAWSFVSSMGWGYGDDLARWSNHITKITAHHQLNDEWTADGSLRVYWGFPGHKDFSRYVHETYLGGGWPETLAAPGWERSYRAAPYLNLGLQYQPCKRFTCRLDGYYLLGIFNKDFNKRIYGGNNPCYRSHAPAVALTAICEF